jgi:hypothetical protein
MSRKNVTANVASSAGFVNLIVTVIAVVLIGAGYFTAVGQFAGVA